MECLLADAEQAGATLALHTQLLSANVAGGRKSLVVQDTTSGEQMQLSTQLVVNSAGGVSG